LVNLANKIVMRPLASLVPYSSNARTHSPAQIELIARSISAYGFTNPILVDDENGIIAGHARYQGAQKLGLSEVPTIALSWLTPAEKQAYIIADNQTAIAGSGWDAEMLRLELGDLQALGFDLSLTGFDEVQLGTFLADKPEGLTDPDDAPPAPEHPTSVAGDLWILGQHRLLCGDSTVVTDVERAMGELKADCLFTDPPYGVSYRDRGPGADSKRAERVGPKSRFAPIAGDELRGDDLEEFLTSAFASAVIACKEGAPWYIWHGALTATPFQAAIEANGRNLSAQIIWAKNQMAGGFGDYRAKHEPCFYCSGGKAAWYAGRDQHTLWTIDKDRNYAHPTQKPTALAERAIINSTKPGDVILDLFAGSGSTIIAAEMTGRTCHAIELSPQYVDVAAKRWQDFTGKQATLDADGRTFADVSAHRRPEQAAA
jgi:DNA modification methylase